MFVIFTAILSVREPGGTIPLGAAALHWGCPAFGLLWLQPVFVRLPFQKQRVLPARLCRLADFVIQVIDPDPCASTTIK